MSLSDATADTDPSSLACAVTVDRNQSRLPEKTSRTDRINLILQSLSPSIISFHSRTYRFAISESIARQVDNSTSELAIEQVAPSLFQLVLLSFYLYYYVHPLD
ncbi:hypothetical protein COCSADRAFT_269327 [Bipolaris sorokiniana ND90Pr]|uniref:Uncharacterized protein n=1 Tax=Cochliobolus sativus (strain ND90Pr / ATCC 201652) TaxID=665912 RepID=M2T0S3_COCSN|nr:uncharacterized protein COCSADRAFT_269327 [Bipolaris sorokiniana ND90Pr]EMD68135.1 hypothetical protein COCSADRAFT_269327 [Bipolaris sorokiniana ND90Pr]